MQPLTNEYIEKKLVEYAKIAGDLTAMASSKRHFDLIKVYINLAYTLGKARGMEIIMMKQEYQERKQHDNI